MTQFKDVAHLYVGCKAKDTFNDVILDWNIKNAHMYTQADSIDQVKPILSPLSYVTEEQKEYIITTMNMGEYELANEMYTPQAIIYLLSNHFDIFGLIASGQAIDATTLTPNPYQNV